VRCQRQAGTRTTGAAVVRHLGEDEVSASVNEDHGGAAQKARLGVVEAKNTFLLKGSRLLATRYQRLTDS
jgi:hypothetical protein